MAEPIKFFLDSLLVAHNDWRFLVVKNWPQIMGHLHSKVSVERIEHETLYVAAYDSCWLTEMYMLSRLILKKVNGVLDEPRIKNIKFFLKEQPSTVKRVSSSKNEQPTVSYPLSQHEQKILLGIKDPILQKSLERYLQRCKYEQTR